MSKQIQTEDFDYSIVGKENAVAIGGHMEYCLKGKMPTSTSSLSGEITLSLRNTTTQKFFTILMHKHQEMYMNMDSNIIQWSTRWGRIKTSHEDSISI